jgi:hypothetical protein
VPLVARSGPGRLGLPATVGDHDVMEEPWWSVVSRATTVMTVPVLQVAADGQWETAEAVPVTGNPATARRVIEQVAQAARNDVAVEILWPGQAFVGVQWPAPLWTQAVAAASRSFVVLATSSPVPPSQPVEAGLLAMLGSTPGTDLDYVELGAVNAWHSIGPEPLWQPGAVLTARAAESVLLRRPDLATCSHPLAVELGVTNPQPCWIGIYVSTGSGPVHRLDPQLLNNVLSSVI